MENRNGPRSQGLSVYSTGWVVTCAERQPEDFNKGLTVLGSQTIQYSLVPHLRDTLSIPDHTIPRESREFPFCLLVGSLNGTLEGTIPLPSDRPRSYKLLQASYFLPRQQLQDLNTKSRFSSASTDHNPRNSLRKYYFVQISTGKSTWDKPTEAAPGAPTLSNTATPAQTANPYQTPNEQVMSGQETEGTRGMGDNQHGESTDRAGGLGGMAMNAILGGNKKQSNNSGSGGLVGQLAGQFLGGGKQTHGSSGQNSGGAGGLMGQLASGFMGGGSKPQNQQGQQSSQHHSSGGIGGMLGGILGGGSHGSSSQNNSYGYTSTGQTGTYSGTAPPTSYTPSGQHQPSAQYQPPSQHQGGAGAYGGQSHQSSYSSQPPQGQYGQTSQHHSTSQYGIAPASGGYGHPAPSNDQYSQHGSSQPGSNYPTPPPPQYSHHQQGNQSGPPGGYGQQTPGQYPPVPGQGQYGQPPSGGRYGQPQHPQHGGGQYGQPPQGGQYGGQQHQQSYGGGYPGQSQGQQHNQSQGPPPPGW
ncbi:hypothetical protein FKW77_004510 [Venturia effusa]|uniref:WW domain-containing protein n=1 Tax=Venturia effusa TaxID=50376 RepID=A0A517LMR6_9PEZI|nr:hypothetical protein FKW77_004510 [Venturia effusa]